MTIIHQLFLLQLINLGARCTRVSTRKSGVGPFPLWKDSDSQEFGPFNETLSLHGQPKLNVYFVDAASGSPSQPVMDVMDIYPSLYPEGPIASDPSELENTALEYPSPAQEEFMVEHIVESDELDQIVDPSVEIVVSSEIDVQPSAAPSLEFPMPSSAAGLQSPELPEFDVLPSGSPAPFSGAEISASTMWPSSSLSGRTAPSRVVGITVAFLVTIGTLGTVLGIAFYGRNINPYMPFITGASLSEESFDFARDSLPDIVSGTHNSRESSSQSRRYDASSLNRDIEPAQRLEAAKLLEDIPDRHCR